MTINSADSRLGSILADRLEAKPDHARIGGADSLAPPGPEPGAAAEVVVGVCTDDQRLCDLGRTDDRTLKRIHHPSVVGIRRPRRAVAR